MESVTNPENVVQKIAALLEERYIFVDKAQQMTAYLRDHAAAYSSIATVGEFARRLTDDLRRISSDKHLHVNYNPVEAAALLLESGDDAASEQEAQYMARENYGFCRLEWMTGGIGYLDLRMFAPPRIAGDTAVAAMNFLANAQAIIFDLRYNGGGSPNMVQLLTTYLFDYDIQHLNTFYIRHTDQHTHFWTLPYVPGKRATHAAVYVLTSKQTFSGAEEFAYNLKVMKRGTIIGETTGGGAHPGDTHALSSQFTIFVPDGRAINPITQTNWEGTGVTPDIQVAAADALRVARREALQKLLDCAQADDERALLTHELDILRTEP
jgi:retinol-binding protein 3